MEKSPCNHHEELRVGCRKSSGGASFQTGSLKSELAWETALCDRVGNRSKKAGPGGDKKPERIVKQFGKATGDKRRWMRRGRTANGNEKWENRSLNTR